jgi:hypothetical protein
LVYFEIKVYLPEQVIREMLLLQRWKWNLTQSLIEYMRKYYGSEWLLRREEEEVRLDLEAGREALRRAMATTWWAWEEGLALFFWRWLKSTGRRCGMVCWCAFWGNFRTIEGLNDWSLMSCCG